MTLEENIMIQINLLFALSTEEGALLERQKALLASGKKRL